MPNPVQRRMVLADRPPRPRTAAQRREDHDRGTMARRGANALLRPAEAQELQGWPPDKLIRAARKSAETGMPLAMLASKHPNGGVIMRLVVVPTEVLARADRLTDFELQQIAVQRVI